MSGPPDEFTWIASLRPLTLADPRALDLMDDVAIIPAKDGRDLVVSKDAMVEGVHFLVGEAPDLIARRLLRAGLSDLAAKGAEAFGYFLMTAWPTDRDGAYREAFVHGLKVDGEAFGVALLGGDTVTTSGPLALSVTVLGWTPAGRTVRRGTARPGDRLLACGAIGDGWLGLRAIKGEVGDPAGRLAGRYRLPRPLFNLREPLLAHARAAADVSDGLLADAAHIAEASGLRVAIELAAMPLSGEAAAWLTAQPDQTAARVALATGGDDYAILCAVDPADVAAFAAAVKALGVIFAEIGRFESGSGMQVSIDGATVTVSRTGWRH